MVQTSSNNYHSKTIKNRTKSDEIKKEYDILLAKEIRKRKMIETNRIGQNHVLVKTIRN